jgi:tetratricopeptide (TPR) repeat protein
MPLAIELAAARANYLSLWDMRAVLGNRLRLLTGGGRDLPPRHRTLAGAIQWSYDLLSSEEQVLFRRLGVFIGGFTPSAVQAICGDSIQSFSKSIEQGETSITFEQLFSLVNKSLVKAETESKAGREVRYGMLEAIREYATQKLYEAPEEASSIERRHARYYMELAEQAEPHLAGPEQLQWLDRLEREHDNLRTALGWARKHNESTEALEMGLRTAAALNRFWYKRGYIGEGREQLAGVLAALDAPVTSTLDRSMQVYRSKTLDRAGILAHLQGDYASARRHYEQALRVRREIDDRVGIAFSLNQLGMLTHEEGDNANARSLYEQSLALYREFGDKAGASSALNSLAILAYEQGDHVSARPLYEQSLAISRELGDKRGIAHLLTALGLLCQTEGNIATARSLFEESLSIWRDFGDPIGVAHTLDKLAPVACAYGDYASARLQYRESLSIFWKAGSTIHALGSLVGLGYASACGGDVRRGAILLGATAALWESMNISPERDSRRLYEEGVAAVRSQLDEQGFHLAWSEGQAMSMEQTVAYALNEA